jgi:hypothetical protein
MDSQCAGEVGVEEASEQTQPRRVIVLGALGSVFRGNIASFAEASSMHFDIASSSLLALS